MQAYASESLRLAANGIIRIRAQLASLLMVAIPITYRCYYNIIHSKSNNSMDNTTKNITTIIADKPMPADEEMERTVLAILMNDPESLDESFGKLSEGMFQGYANRLIYKAIADVYERHLSIDYALVINKLHSESCDTSVLTAAAQILQNYTTSALLEEDILKLREFALRRGMIRLCTESMNGAYNLVSAVDDVLDKMQADLNALTDTLALTSSKDGEDVVKECIAEMEEAKFSRGTVAVSSGIPELDEIVSQGWRPGDSIIIAARPSVGKTAFAVNLALNAVKNGMKVGFFSAEMARNQIGYRMISYITGVPGTLLRSDEEMSLADWNAVRDLVKGSSPLHDLFIDDTPAISIAEFTARARKMVRMGVGVIFVDYLQLMTGGQNRYNVREQEVAAVSHAIKAVAKRYGIPVVALAQLSRQAQFGGSDGRGPQLCDLRESGAIEQDADIVIFLSPTTALVDQSEASREIKLTVAKNRNGQTGELMLKMDPGTMRFKPMSDSLNNYAATTWVPLK